MMSSTERRIRIKRQQDVVAASRTGLAIARRMGLSLREQFRLAGIARDLARDVVAAEACAVCVIRGMEEAGVPLVKVSLE
jgi:hypothetical protein